MIFSEGPAASMAARSMRSAQQHDDTGLALEPLVQFLDRQRQLARVQVDVVVRGQAGNGRRQEGGG